MKDTSITSEKAQLVIVEDDPFISRMYQMKIGQAGYKLAVGENGRDAVELITQHQPRLAMIEIHMREMGGFEVIKHLSSNGYDLSRTAFILLTNLNNPNDIERAKAIGAEYLIKADQTPRSILALIQKKLDSTA